jgi:murein DD-endopeptidase MepM/ murein hydrolase activator NlpD
MRAALALLLALAGGLSAADAPPLRIEEVRREGEVQVWGHNQDPYAVRWAWVELVGASNVRPDGGLPRGFVLQPQDRRLLFTLRPQDPNRGFSYGLRTRSGEGDPEREPDSKAVYLLPFAHGSKHVLGQGYFGRATHSGMHALDFDMPQGTPLHAARAGVVIRVKQDGTRGGMMRSDAADGNVVQVLHDDATWAVYAHLQHRGSRVQVGQRVRAGELIALSGDTGLASGPHLHFAVYRAGWDGPRTVPTVFKTGPDESASLQEGRTYYAWHPGGAPFTPVLGEALRHEDLQAVTRTAAGGAFKLREERVDRRVLVWAANGMASAVQVQADLERPVGVRSSVGLPHKAVIPPRTEAFLFYVDFVGEGASSYRLRARYHPLPAGTAP